VLRALGVPGAEFRIGLAAHDLAGAMGAPEVVLTRAIRDAEGPTRPSRFLLRVEALLGEEEADRHRDTRTPALLPLIDRAPKAAPVPYPRPRPDPAPDLRRVDISATALDRLLGDPYQFFAQKILSLKKLDPLAADPFEDPGLRGTLVHEVLEQWHKARLERPDLPLVPFADAALRRLNPHPLFLALWRPRILDALGTFQRWIDEGREEGREVIVSEGWGEMTYGGVRVFGKADRVDRLPDGTFAIVDYKTGTVPSASQVESGFALQLGVLGLIARHGGFDGAKGKVKGEATRFEYWSLGRSEKEEGFGKREEPLKIGNKKKGLEPERFLPEHERFLSEAIARFITGTEPFTAKENPAYPGYTDYDQLMRLEEWVFEARSGERSGGGEGAA
jgi:ATP-dependent helicase/nuclease subunit B